MLRDIHGHKVTYFFETGRFRSALIWTHSKGRFGVGGGRSDGADAEDDAEVAVGVAGAGDAEVTYLAGVLDVLAQAGAEVVVADTHQAQRLAGVGRQAVQTDALGHIVAADEGGGDGQVLGDEGVDARLNVGHLLGGGTDGQAVVDLALLALDVGIARALAAEEAHHGLVEQVLGGVGRAVLVLVVGVEDGLVQEDGEGVGGRNWGDWGDGAGVVFLIYNRNYCCPVNRLYVLYQRRFHCDMPLSGDEDG